METLVLDLRNKNRSLGSFNLNEITASSQPVYDEYNWIPGNQNGWGVIEWIRWHQELVKSYGLADANQRFLQAWKAQSSFAWPYSFFKYDGDFTEYMEKVGIDIGNLVSTVVVAASDTVESAAGVVVDASEGIKNTIGVAKYLLPVLITSVVVGVGYYGYKHYIKGDDRIKAYGVKV